MLIRSMLLSGVRPVYAAAGDPPSGGNDDAGNQGGDPPADGDAGNDGAGDPPAANDGAGNDGAGDPPAAGAAGAAGDDDPPAQPTETWKDKEIRRKHAQLQEARRAAAEKDAEIESLRAIAQRTGGDPAAGGDGAGDPPARTTTQSLSREDVQREASLIVAQQNFDKMANDADAAGRSRFKGDWDKATDTLKTLGGFDMGLMTTILATDDPAQVLFTLGSKPEEYQRIMELPEARQRNELIKLGIPVAPVAKKVSDAAPPVNGVRARPIGSATELRDDLDDDAWYARRAAQKKARWEAKRAGKVSA